MKQKGPSKQSREGLQLFMKVLLCYQNIYYGLQDDTIQGSKILKAINLIPRKQISPTRRRLNFGIGQEG